MNKSRINKSKIIYHVHKDKRVVVCTITGCKYIALDRILKYAPSLYYDERFDRYVLIKDSYTGVAKCAPEDEWDEEYGKKLALLKAKQKRCHAINSKIKRYVELLKAETAALIKYGIHEIPKEI